MSSLYFDAGLGLHTIFALVWIIGTFVSLQALLRLSKQPTDVSSAKRARIAQMLKAVGGGLTVILGLGFYYYINVYRTAYATSSAGLPLVDSGAVLGLIVLIWQMSQASRIRNALKALSATGASTPQIQTTNTATLPKSWMLIVPSILLVLAFLLMIGGTTM